MWLKEAGLHRGGAKCSGGGGVYQQVEVLSGRQVGVAEVACGVEHPYNSLHVTAEAEAVVGQDKQLHRWTHSDIIHSKAVVGQDTQLHRWTQSDTVHSKAVVGQDTQLHRWTHSDTIHSKAAVGQDTQLHRWTHRVSVRACVCVCVSYSRPPG